MKATKFVKKSAVAKGQFVVKNTLPTKGSIVYYTKAELKTLMNEIRRVLDRNI